MPISPTAFLLPSDPSAYGHWAVIACDQFSTDPHYWQQVAAEVGTDPSLLHCIIRDAELSSPGLKAKVAAVHQAMERYRQELRPTEAGVMVVERWLPGHPVARQGVVAAADLEQFDFRQGAGQIRPTEGIILERLPLRHQVRLGASLDVSHIVLLIDDPDRQVIEPLFKALRPPTYGAELMQGGGRVTGSLLAATSTEAQGLLHRLAALRGRVKLVVGDGNHSLAAARLAWESLKAKGAGMDHPARYALVEVANLHSRAIDVQPIHRLIRGFSGAEFIERALRLLPGSSFEPQDHGLSFSALYGRMLKSQDHLFTGHQLPVKAADVAGILTVPQPKAKLAIATVEALIKGLAPKEPIGYVHGTKELDRLVSHKARMVGLHLPRLDKSRLFESIMEDGPLPAKAFSLGAAREKRYYLETRSLVPG